MQTEELKRLAANLKEKKVTLVAVSKTKTPDEIMRVYDAGIRIFGESKAQELAQKHGQLPGDIQWHFIGHLQKNKVKYIAPFVALIHSAESFDLLREMNKRAMANNRVIDFLFQLHIAKEETKFGLNESELISILENPELRLLTHVRACGVMGMATLTDNKDVVRNEFRALRQLFQAVKEKYFAQDAHFREISMGMSGDYEIAIEEGSTMVRLGTMLFGERV